MCECVTRRRTKFGIKSSLAKLIYSSAPAATRYASCSLHASALTVIMGNVVSVLRTVVNQKTLPVAAVCVVLALARLRKRAERKQRQEAKQANASTVRQRCRASAY